MFGNSVGEIGGNIFIQILPHGLFSDVKISIERIKKIAKYIL